ncbi:MAG: ABC transporter substrate-binding protein [Geminicoccaceae bacterium]|nr:ABC transporter substrate-binding protein [Geminicoccaceae bacterium]
MRTILKSLVLGSVATVALAASARADCGEVTITEMNWASSSVVTAVAKFLMEEGYGCDVTAVPSDTVPAVTSVAETGRPDIVTELWINSAPQYVELEKEGKVETLGAVLSDGGEEGWFVPAYLVEEHPELATIDGVLANPALVGGRFHNCPEGWGCRTKNDNLKVAYGFEEAGMEVFDHGSGETLATSMASAYEDRQPWFGYYWKPTSLLGRYDMVKVDMGEYDAERHACIAREDCRNPQKTDFQTAEVLTGVTTDFAEREPEIASMMSKLSFTNDQMGGLLAWQEANKASAEEVAVKFLSENPDVWGAWLNDEAREKLAPLLNR